MIKKTIITFFYIFYAIGLYSMNSAEELQYYQNKYPDQKMVEINSKQSLQINVVKGKLEIYQEEYLECICLTDFTTGYGKERIYYSSMDTLLKIEAYTLVPEGNKYKKVPVKKFSYYSDDTSNYIFYDDSEVCSFVFPALSKGCKTIYRIKKKINSPFFIHSFFFSKGYTTDFSEIQFNYDNNVEMQFNEIGIPSGKLETNTNKTSKSTIVTYTLKNIPQTEHEENVRGMRGYIPHIVPRISNYKTKENGTVEILASLDHLYKLYNSHVQSIDKTPEPGIKHMADSVTMSSTTEFDKVKAIYNWVQHNIRYVAIEDGDKGFIPEGAASVFNKRYGDCKGMTNLMKTMLDSIGIKSYFTWVGTSRLPYKYTEIPSPTVDNHMILYYVKNDGKGYILDATSDYQSIEYAPDLIQGKECMIAIDNNTYQIVEIPYSFNLVSENIRIDIDGTSLKMKDTACYNGNYKNLITYSLAHISNTEKQKLYQSMLNGEGYPKSTVYNFQHSDIYDVDAPLCLYGNFELQDYLIEIADELYMKIYFGKVVETTIDIDKRKYPFSLSNKGGWQCHQTINIPKEYTISYLPENIDFIHSLFSLKLSLKKNKNQLFVDIDYHEDFITLPTEDYEKWNEMNKLIRQIRNQSIILKKTKSK